VAVTAMAPSPVHGRGGGVVALGRPVACMSNRFFLLSPKWASVPSTQQPAAGEDLSSSFPRILEERPRAKWRAGSLGRGGRVWSKPWLRSLGRSFGREHRSSCTVDGFPHRI
jgi:hypothetical protein